MHAAAFLQAGIDATYEAVRVTTRELPQWLASARATLAGFNVTIPHKEVVASLVDRSDAASRELSAVNTVICAEPLLGFNTDLPGFLATVRELGIDIRDRNVLVFGAGGSARAVVRGLRELGAVITVVSRSERRAQRLLEAVGGTDRQTHDSDGHQDLVPQSPRGCTSMVRTIHVLHSDDPAVSEAVSHSALLVNATPLGMTHLADGNPLCADAPLHHQPAIIDLVYGRTTPLIARARQACCPYLDGVELLVQQGAISFLLWTGVEPDRDVMRRACRAHLET
jgi:shikimate dehydrogenase